MQRKHIIICIIGIFILGAIAYGIYRAKDQSSIETEKIIEQDAYSVKKYKGKIDGKDTYTIETSLAPQWFKDTDDTWQSYDTNIVKSNGSYDYQLAASDHQAYFRDTVGNESIIRVEKNQKPLQMTPHALYYVNDEGQKQLIAQPNKNASAVTKDNTITYKSIYGDGIDMRFTTTHTQVIKELVIKKLDSLPEPKISNAYLELKLGIETTEETKIKLPSEEGETDWIPSDNKTDIQNGAIFTDSNNAPLYAFPSAVARDSKKGRERQLISSVGSTDSKLKFFLQNVEDSITVTVGTPYSWLKKAQFPVMIDPTIDLQVNATNNDVYYGQSFDHYSNNGYDGYLFAGTWDNLGEHVGLRFTNVTIPSGSTITSSTIQVYGEGIDDIASVDKVHLKIWGDDVDNPPEWSSSGGNRPHEITQTTAGVDWDPVTWPEWGDPAWVTSPDISSIVQELIDRPGWSSGNAMRFAVWNDDTVGPVLTVSWQDYSLNSSVAAKIHIEYTEPEPVVNDPIAHWKLDETSGSTAFDEVNNHNGTISDGITLGTPGKINTAFTLGGSSGQYVAIADHPDFQLSNGTLSAWIKTSSPGSTYRAIFTKQQAYGLFLKDGVLIIYDWGASADRTTAVNLADNEWHHVLVTFQSGVLNGTKIYIDGELVLTTTMTIASQTSGLSIGSGSAAGNNQNFAGSIDDVRIYDRLLSGAEVKLLYESGGWYNNNWEKRVKITVNSTQVADNVTDFPVYVDLLDLPADFHANVNQIDARDIRVTTSDGSTEVPREVVFYDSGTDTGELHFKAPTLSATSDTNFYIYYGNPSATEPAADSTYGSQNVWNEDYVFVSHDGGVSDSTSNVYTATNNNSSINIAGKLGSSRDYNGTNSYTSLPNITSEFSTNATITAWTKLNIATPITDTQTGIWWFGNSSTNNTHYVWSDGTAYMATFRNVRVESIPPSGSVNRTQWHHLSITTTPGTNGWKMYQNAILLTQVTGLNSVYIDANTYIGKSYGTYYLNGSLDEIRISSTERSAGWIQNEYNNQNSPSAFYEIGASEENPNVTPTPTNTPTPTSTLTPTPTPTTGPTPTPLPPGSQEMYFEGVDLEGLDIF